MSSNASSAVTLSSLPDESIERIVQCLGAMELVEGVSLPCASLGRVNRRLHRIVSSVLYRTGTLHLTDDNFDFDALEEYIWALSSGARHVKLVMCTEPSNTPSTRNRGLSRGLDAVSARPLHITEIQLSDMFKYTDVAQTPDAMHSFRALLRNTRLSLTSLVLTDVPIWCQLVSDAHLPHIQTLKFSLEQKENYPHLKALLSSFAKDTLRSLDVYFGQMPEELVRHPAELASLCGNNVRDLKLSFASNGADLVMIGVPESAYSETVYALVTSFMQLSTLSISGNCGYPQWIDRIRPRLKSVKSISVDAYFACHYGGFGCALFRECVGKVLCALHIPDTVHVVIDGDMLVDIVKDCTNIAKLSVCVSKEMADALKTVCCMLSDSLVEMCVERRRVSWMGEEPYDSGGKPLSEDIFEAVLKTTNLERLYIGKACGALDVDKVEKIVMHCGENLREVEMGIGSRRRNERESGMENGCASTSSLELKDMGILVGMMLKHCPRMSAVCLMKLLEKCGRNWANSEQQVRIVQQMVVQVLLDRSNNWVRNDCWMPAVKQWAKIKKLLAGKRICCTKDEHIAARRMWIGL